ncbi:MAG: DoxX family protein [Lysobacterales bacterium]|jgi:putative oxidoreductase
MTESLLNLERSEAPAAHDNRWFALGATPTDSAAAGDIGALVLRVALGLVFLAHSVWLKLVVFTLPGTAEFFASIGLPGGLAYLVFAAETVGGVALISGFYARFAALALLPIALGACWAHLGFGWLFTNSGGGWEYPAMLAVALVVQFFIGDGTLAWRRSQFHGSRG